MIVTALKSFDHDRQKVRRGEQLNVTSHTARDMRARGLVTFGGEAIGDPLADPAGESQSASPAGQVAPPTTSGGSAVGDSPKRKRKKRPAAE